jgi:hypothetical protein
MIISNRKVEVKLKGRGGEMQVRYIIVVRWVSLVRRCMTISSPYLFYFIFFFGWGEQYFIDTIYDIELGHRLLAELMHLISALRRVFIPLKIWTAAISVDPTLPLAARLRPG